MNTEREADTSSSAWTTTFRRRAGGWVLATALCCAAATPAMADAPGRGPTAQFEKNYLVFIIDHHYSALRMTELAAGTDRTRDAALSNPLEGTAPSPYFGTTPAKAADEQIRSMARQANRVQREEIGKAQHFLRDWYGMHHDPVLNAEARKMIDMLERTPAGTQFDPVFLRSISNHHLSALAPSLLCQVKSDLLHDGLRRYCDDIVVTQKNSINDMREMLCKKFSDCDFVPTTGDLRKDHD